MSPSFEIEIEEGFPRFLIAGVDEVGRGCLAGPVVACAVISGPEPSLGEHAFLSEVSDSKLLSPEKRLELKPQIEAWARAFSIGEASVAEIDELNILRASHLAMLRALEGLPPELKESLKCVLVDGNLVPREMGKRFPGVRARPVVKGDLKCMSIAAASILAKIHRDDWITRISIEPEFSVYGFPSHKGYSTPAHRDALKAHGPSRLHRRSFAPVRELL